MIAKVSSILPACLVLALLCSLVAAPAIAQEISAGQAAKLAGECVVCHGENGRGIAGNFPSLAGQSEYYLLKRMLEIRAGKTKAAGLMAGSVSYKTDSELQALAAYFAALQPRYGVASPDSARLAENLYLHGDSQRGIPACAACHGSSGEGIAYSTFPRLAGQSAGYTFERLREYAAEDAIPTGQGLSQAMYDIAGRLNVKEMRSLASWLEGRRP